MKNRRLFTCILAAFSISIVLHWLLLEVSPKAREVTCSFFNSSIMQNDNNMKTLHINFFDKEICTLSTDNGQIGLLGSIIALISEVIFFFPIFIFTLFSIISVLFFRKLLRKKNDV